MASPHINYKPEWEEYMKDSELHSEVTSLIQYFINGDLRALNTIAAISKYLDHYERHKEEEDTEEPDLPSCDDSNGPTLTTARDKALAYISSSASCGFPDDVYVYLSTCAEWYHIQPEIGMKIGDRVIIELDRANYTIKLSPVGAVISPCGSYYMSTDGSGFKFRDPDPSYSAWNGAMCSPSDGVITAEKLAEAAEKIRNTGKFDHLSGRYLTESARSRKIKLDDFFSIPGCVPPGTPLSEMYPEAIVPLPKLIPPPTTPSLDDLRGEDYMGQKYQAKIPDLTSLSPVTSRSGCKHLNTKTVQLFTSSETVCRDCGEKLP